MVPISIGPMSTCVETVSGAETAGTYNALTICPSVIADGVCVELESLAEAVMMAGAATGRSLDWTSLEPTIRTATRTTTGKKPGEIRRRSVMRFKLTTITKT